MEDKLPHRITWFAPWTWKRRRLWIVIGLSLAILGYPLSIGPVAALMYRGWIPPSFVYTVYKPIEMIAGMSESLTIAIRWYISLFRI